jgi:hypothetical protein
LVRLHKQLTRLIFLSLNLRMLTHADDMLVAVCDQVDAGVLESGLRPHAHISNARMSRHKSETMPLNGIDISTPFLMVKPSQSVHCLDVFFKDDAVDTRLQQESMLIRQQRVVCGR